MGIMEFDRIIERTLEQGKRQSMSPDSWEGYESDPFWQGAHKTG